MTSNYRTPAGVGEGNDVVQALLPDRRRHSHPPAATAAMAAMAAMQISPVRPSLTAQPIYRSTVLPSSRPRLTCNKTWHCQPIVKCNGDYMNADLLGEKKAEIKGAFIFQAGRASFSLHCPVS